MRKRQPVDIRLTGTPTDVRAVLLALGILRPGGWNLGDIHTRKRSSRVVQAYTTLTHHKGGN